ncbi:type IIA DNA topoisomerase subunit B [Salinibacterium sp. NSLL150]|uniref:DNA gyrase/topoisomerase IV subunit B n=1 Tax=unclassified Salinibacterium TaxID=2632331 RepID=UPI0018CDE540|nr:MULTISPECIES: DNA topoisomerase IV subunit B [unclassified Salinibacterium]MBH0099011.1 type IIA DNA topoisomerase subunit B [Salinibacterium sp. NSLL35]MBH0101765.1 type IIA DNA topoisomerase subunit B [Salinibacterium sp. NSLL150]MBH0104525.1 type IIA DNA topoisomerase subunit B [Salinibacterium sp. NSLL16]MBH0107285.1 type IIA DNA topoisomerase subunit B [Salinibacterium sp. NSLL17]MBH0108938.1 type IIA DNA topoisomerase subunit B [Salinibacterium sp. NG22]
MASSDYSARHLSVLEGLEAVRKRPGMYIGSTDSRGLMHCLWEIIDNSVDEALDGHGSEINVILHADESVEVRDKARGIPVDVEPKTGLTGVEVVFTKLHAGGKFGSGSYAASGGLHGVGASVVNALSERLDVEVDRNGKTYAMSFHRGEPGTFADTGEPTPDAPFSPYVSGSELRVIGKVPKGRTGTRVRYWADRQIFTKGASFQSEGLIDRLRQTAFLVPNLTLNVSDERGEEPIRESFSFEGGISEFVEHLAVDPPITDIWRLTGSGGFTESVPVLQDNGHMVSTEVSRDCVVDVALRWGTGYDTVIKSFVNIIATPKGGTHLAGFEQSLLKFLRAETEKNARRLKLGNDKLDKDDVLAGLTVVLTVRLPEPQFEGQTKEILGTPAVRAIVAKVVAAALSERFTSTKRDDKSQAALVLDKVVAEMKSRISARAHKETQRRKNALESSSLPAKLVDCRSNDVANSELFIVEGDSALGTAKLGRDSEYQALLPIRGKILNVQKASISDMLSNAECASIIQVIGAGSGRSFDLSTARYGKVIIMADADVDGAHIRTLLLTLFFRYMPDMIRDGRVYAAVPPLHRVVVINPGSKPNETIYTYSEKELNGVLAGLKKSGKRYQDPIQRYKGLGEMDADQLATTTMDRNNRVLRRVNISDAESAGSVFELLMGNEVAPRKEFIIQGQGLDRDRIDI